MVTEEHAPVPIDLHLEFDPFRGCRRREGIRGVLNDPAQVHKRRFDPELAGQDTRRIEQIGDELCLKLRILMDGFHSVLATAI